MIYLLADQTIEQVSARGDLTSWLLATLAAVCAAAFSYLVGMVKAKDTETKAANGEMIKIFREVVTKSDERHLQQVAEHSKDRDAFLQNTGQLTHAIEASTKAQEAIANRVERLTNELRKSNPAIVKES